MVEGLSPVLMPRTPSRRRKDLRAIFAEGVAWSVMVGLGETYFSAFVLALGMGEVWAGLIATIPVLAGGALQLLTPYGVGWLRSRRRWVTGCAAVQAVSFLPFIWGAATGRLHGVAVFVVAAVYWGAGMAAGPAWNAWVTQLVPESIRMRYFARRTWATQIGVLCGLLGGGLVLQHFRHRGHELIGFALIFSVATVFRAVSSRLVSTQSENAPPVGGERLVIGRELLRRFWSGRDGRLLLYLVVLTASVSVASPFFSPYMLKQLGFSYTSYMVMIGASFAAKILMLSGLDRITRKFGILTVLRVAGFGIVGVPALWLLSSWYPYLLGLQVLAGCCWAAQEFAAFLLLIEVIRLEERTSLLTTYNLLNAAMTVAGSLLGGVLFEAAGGAVVGYRALFAVSAVVRFGAVLLLVRVAPIPGPSFRVLLRTIAVRPSAGALSRPIAATIRRRDVLGDFRRLGRGRRKGLGPPPTEPGRSRRPRG